MELVIIIELIIIIGLVFLTSGYAIRLRNAQKRIDEILKDECYVIETKIGKSYILKSKN